MSEIRKISTSTLKKIMGTETYSYKGPVPFNYDKIVFVFKRSKKGVSDVESPIL